MRWRDTTAPDPHVEHGQRTAWLEREGEGYEVGLVVGHIRVHRSHHRTRYGARMACERMVKQA